MTLWIVGEWRSGETCNSVWDLVGVFSSEVKAVAACVRTDHFLYPVELDAVAPDETCVPPGFRYPLEDRAPAEQE